MNEFDYEEIGRKIKRMRQLRGLTQESLAELTGYDQPKISKIQKGFGTDSLNKLSIVSDALNIGLEDLIFMTEEQMETKYNEQSALTKKEEAKAIMDFINKTDGMSLYCENYGNVLIFNYVYKAIEEKLNEIKDTDRYKKIKAVLCDGFEKIDDCSIIYLKDVEPPKPHMRNVLRKELPKNKDEYFAVRSEVYTEYAEWELYYPPEDYKGERNITMKIFNSPESALLHRNKNAKSTIDDLIKGNDITCEDEFYLYFYPTRWSLLLNEYESMMLVILLYDSFIDFSEFEITDISYINYLKHGRIYISFKHLRDDKSYTLIYKKNRFEYQIEFE